MKKLSIITCTYNSDKYLQECVDSIKAQNLDKCDFEHIFVDGKSSDGTKEIIDEYKKKTGYNIYFYVQNPKGVYAAMNYGAKKAAGEYLMFVNSDDWLEYKILQEYLNFIKSTGNKDLYYGIQKSHIGGAVRNSSVHPLMETLFKISGFNGIIQHPTVIMRKDCFMECGMFDETKKIASDQGMRLEVLSRGMTIKCFPKKVSNFRMHSESLSTVNTELGGEETMYFRKKYLPGYKYYLCVSTEKLIKLLSYIINKLSSFSRKIKRH